MSNPNDFVIENGVLTDYNGPGGDIAIPEGVTEIHSEAFQPPYPGFCFRDDIISVSLPNSLKHLSAYAFYSCTNLADISFSPSIQSIGASAFDRTAWLERQEKGLVRGGTALIKYSGEETQVTIPDDVTCLAYGAFSSCKYLQTVVIPDSVSEISDAAFMDCSSLTEIRIPDSVKVIGSAAFSGCKALKTLSLPDGIESIGKDAFKNCSPELTLLYEGKKYSLLPKDRRSYLARLWLKNKHHFSAAQDTAIKKEIQKSKKELFLLIKWGGNDTAACRKCSDPQEKKALAKLEPVEKLLWDDAEMLARLLSACDWSSNEIDECIDSLHEGQHPQMAAVLLEYKNAHYLHSNASAPDEMSKSVEIDPFSPEEIKKNWKYQKDNKVGGYKITGYLGDAEAPVMPSQIGNVAVVAIGQGAFKDCEQIRSMVLPDSLRIIGDSAFAYCRNLTELIFPNGIKELPKSVFFGCEKLKSVTLPADLESIAAWTFPPRCNTSVQIKEANYALEEIMIDPNNPNFGTDHGVLYEKKTGKLLHYPSAKHTYVLPDFAKKLPTGFFAFSELSEIQLHKKLASISMMAFYGCSKLLSVTIPEGKTKEIGSYAFSNCSNLNDIILPRSIQNIGDFAFSGCPNLTIHAPAGSYAEQYAKEHNIPFEAE